MFFKGTYIFFPANLSTIVASVLATTVIGFSFKGTVIFETFEKKPNVPKLNVLFAFPIVQPNKSTNEI